MKHTILLTGASGMLGSRVAAALCDEGHRVIGADRADAALSHANYAHIRCDMTNPDAVAQTFADPAIDRVIHLAALAHVTGETDLSYGRYFRINVLISQAVFECAAARKIPVFFSSTVDVYGVPSGPISEHTIPAPVGGYARTKYEAEKRLRKIMGETAWFIARFAPVYTDDDRHDIQKRYYLKYPKVAFVVGKGIDYAFLSIDRVVKTICLWARCETAPRGIVNITDDEPFNSAKMVALEKTEGRAGTVLPVPAWVGKMGLFAAKFCPAMLRLNVNKILNPYRFDDKQRKAFFSGRDGGANVSAPADLTGVRVLLLEGFARQSMAIMPALKQLGCHVTTYNSSKLDLGYASRWPDRKLIAPWNRDDADFSFRALMDVLRRDKYDVVIPLTDFSAALLSSHYDEIAGFAAPAVNRPEAFIQAADKQNTMQACVRANVPCPHTLYDMATADDIIAAGMPYPFIIKPRIGYGSIGFHVIHNEAELKEVFDSAIAKHGPMVVQDYIPQTGTQYKCQVFLDDSGCARSAVVFDKTRWYPVDGGSTCCSTSVHRPDIAADSIRLLQEMGWRGYGDVDLIEDPRDGSVKVMEVNPRITASVKVCFAAGVDFARQIVEHALGLPVTAYPHYRDGVQLRYMHTDLLWFIQSPNRFRARPSWFKFTRTVDQIFSLCDPWPWFTYSIQAVKKRKTEMKKRER